MIRNKIISMILVAVMLITAILPILQTKVKAADGIIDYQGSVTYGESTVGKFYVNGKIAFCLEHRKTTPPSGREVTSQIYDNPNIIKCLYYGWKGEKQWKFQSEEQAIVYTTLAIDHFANGNSNRVAQDFINYVNSQPVPVGNLNFRSNNLKAYIQNGKQITQTDEIVGDSSLYITIPLQEGVVLVNETKGTKSTGNVNIYGGDRFHLEAPINISGSWKSDPINNHKYAYQAIVYKTESIKEQDLVSSYGFVTDTNSYIRLYVNWISAGKLQIYKKDEETQNTIDHTTFEIKDEKGELVETITTNESGYAESLDLVAGLYTVTEKSSNDEYILDNTPRKVTISAGETITLDITNKHKEGGLKIVKVDSRDVKTPISDVTFEIWNIELNKKVATKTTGEDGTITLNNLRTGTYKIKEVSTNEWYELNTDEKLIEVKADETVTLTIENEVKKGYIEVIKSDEDYPEIKLEGIKFEIRNSKGLLLDTLVTNENGYAKSKALPLNDSYSVKEIETNNDYVLQSQIENVTFTVEDNQKTKLINFTNKHKKGNIILLKVDANNNKIGMGGVEFNLYSDEFQKVIGRYITDRNGEIHIDNLRTGKYKLIEISTNKWYDLAPDTEVIVEENTTKEVTIQNSLKKGSIKIVKVDKDNNEIRLPNVTFEVQDRNGNVLETIVTNEKGEATTKAYPVRDYPVLRLHEIQTNELYALNNNVLQVSLEANKVKNLKIENEKKKGQIKVIKVDKDNEQIKLSNVEFEVLDENKNVVDVIVTDENGEAITKKLPIDQKYTIRETKTLQEYKLIGETSNIVVEYGKVTNVILQNEKKKGQIEIYKTDEENNEIKLEGVEFQIINSNGEIVETIRTDENGYAKTSKLPIGEYQIKEIKTKDEYVLNNEIIKVEITEDKVAKLNITNKQKKGQIKIIKTSKDNNFINGEKAGSPISNVRFEVYDANKNLVDIIMTDEEGIAITKKLDKGKYFIKEVESGEWYLLNEEEFVAEINENEELVELNITNESEKPDVDIEKTGDTKAEQNKEIKYELKVANTGNVALNNFAWYDFIPTEYAKITKMYTGTYSENLNYTIYYRTNMNAYKVLASNLNTQVNNYIDLSKVKLEEGEVIEKIRVDFGKVSVGFKTITNAEVFLKLNNNVSDGEKFTNRAQVEADLDDFLLWKDDDQITQIEKKKLPRTGF